MNQQKTGQFLKELRGEKSITQAELAEILGVSNRSISRWENGVTMPDFDLLIELAKYYKVEVGEILDGERRGGNSSDEEFREAGMPEKEKGGNSSMDSKKMEETEELMLKVADYNNTEYNFFSKRICVMFVIAVIGMGIYAVIDMADLTRIQPYEWISNCVLGFVTGTLLTGVLYSSRYMVKLRAAKMRLISKIRKINDK